MSEIIQVVHVVGAYAVVCVAIPFVWKSIRTALTAFVFRRMIRELMEVGKAVQSLSSKKEP